VAIYSLFFNWDIGNLRESAYITCLTICNQNQKCYHNELKKVEIQKYQQKDWIYLKIISCPVYAYMNIWYECQVSIIINFWIITKKIKLLFFKSWF